ncbi:hypothetical protein FEF09_24975 [Chitinophaga pinensis]|uniref:Uncharacterized protein n=1 Tax=Chitinophaga pinensis TaxID=79329 RepID=A0A5C6LMX6_9BACT|nr:hypothetical protein FEF09_24975 [Chitinophaga pinensis]
MRKSIHENKESKYHSNKGQFDFSVIHCLNFPQIYRRIKRSSITHPKVSLSNQCYGDTGKSKFF